LCDYSLKLTLNSQKLVLKDDKQQREIHNHKHFSYLGSCILHEENVLVNQLPELFVKDIVVFRIMCINKFVMQSNGNQKNPRRRRAETMEDIDRGKDTDAQKNNDGVKQHQHSASFSAPRARKSDWVFLTDSDIKTAEINSDDDDEDASDNEEDEDVHNSFNTHSIFDVNERVDVCRIYPNSDTLSILKSNSGNLIKKSAASFHQQQSLDEEEEDDQNKKDILIEVPKPEEQKFVGLFIYKCGEASIVSLFEIYDFNNAASIQRALIKHLRTQCSKSLHSIDRKLEKLQLIKSMRQVPTTTNQTNLENNRIDVENQPYVLVDRMRVKKQKSNVQGARRGSTGDARSSIMMFNTSDQMLTTNSTSESFLQRCSLAHELLNMNKQTENDKSMSQITKLYLKSSSHLLYAKKMFGSEVIYHQQIQSGATNQSTGKVVEHFKLDVLENNVREAIRRDFHINML
jgi:hypothetical protein